MFKKICEKIDSLFEKYAYLSSAARIFYSFVAVFIATVIGLLLKSIPINTMIFDIVSLVIVMPIMMIVAFLILSIIKNAVVSKVLVLMTGVTFVILFLLFLILIITGNFHMNATLA